MKGDVKKNQSHQKGGAYAFERKSCPKTGQLTMHTRLSVSSPPLSCTQSGRHGATSRIQVKLEGNAPSRAEEKKKKALEKERGKREGWRHCVCV